MKGGSKGLPMGVEIESQRPPIALKVLQPCDVHFDPPESRVHAYKPSVPPRSFAFHRPPVAFEQDAEKGP
jgi:hypothetical protein